MRKNKRKLYWEKIKRPQHNIQILSKVTIFKSLKLYREHQTMEGTELKILFTQNKAYLTSDRSMTFEQIGLEHIKEKVFRSPAYWTFRVKKYIQNERKIFCEILSYNIGETEFANNQLQLSAILNTLETVTFRSIDTDGLLNTLSMLLS